MHVDEKQPETDGEVKCRGITCCRYMAVCMYLCSPGDVPGHGIGLTSGESDTQKDLASDAGLSRINFDSGAVMVSAKHMGKGRGRVILAPLEALDTYRVPTGCPRSWARVLQVWACHIFF